MAGSSSSSNTDSLVMSSSSSVRSTSASSATGSSSSTVSPSRSDHPRSRRAHAPDPPRLAGLFVSESSAIPQLRRTPILGLGPGFHLVENLLDRSERANRGTGERSRLMCESSRKLLCAEQLFNDDLGFCKSPRREFSHAQFPGSPVPRFSPHPAPHRVNVC